MENPKQTWIRNGGFPMKMDTEKFTEDTGNLQLPNDVFFSDFPWTCYCYQHLPTIICNIMVVIAAFFFPNGLRVSDFPWWKSMCVDDPTSYTT